MCGIGGIINLSKNNKKFSSSDISVIKKYLMKRGPDSSGSWISKNRDVLITIQRLATQDHRSIADQPCTSFDKNIVLIMNGEIYNHKELRKILEREKYKFYSNNDAEVAANAYHFWGDKFLEKLNGQFAIFAIDKRKNVGLIARDEHGICPLYYCIQNKKIVFSSSPESIHKQLRLNLKISKKGLADFIISGCMTENNTFFEQIKYLSPGKFIKFKVGKSSYKIKEYKKNKKVSSKKIKPILLDSTKSRLQGSKKVGIFLSGGIDSTFLLALYRKLYPKAVIKSFTAAFEDDESKKLVGEHDQVKKICKFYKSKNNIIKITSRNIINHINNSPYPTSGLLEYCFESLAKVSRSNNIQVVLSGEGADEMFFGYDHNLALIGIFKKNYKFLNRKFKLRSYLKSEKNLNKKKIQDLFLIGGADLDLEKNRKNVFSNKVIKTRSLKSSITKVIKSYKLRNPENVDKIITKLDYDIKIPELQLRRAENPAMCQGVEMRFPYLNNELKNKVYSTPLKQKISKSFVEKKLLRNIAQSILPKKIMNPKLPFGVPAIRHGYYEKAATKFKKPAFKYLFFKNFKKMKKTVLYGAHKKLNFFNNKFLASIVDKQKKPTSCFYDPVLWRIWSFASWYEKLK